MLGYWTFPCLQKSLGVDTVYLCLSAMELLHVHDTFPNLPFPAAATRRTFH
jgi:hypothetical protein